MIGNCFPIIEIMIILYAAKIQSVCPYREFRLRLHPDPGSVFADDVEFHNTDGPVDFHPGNVYSGTLDGKLHKLIFI